MFTKRFFKVLFLTGITGLSFGMALPNLNTLAKAPTENKTSYEAKLSSKKNAKTIPNQILECVGGGNESFTNLGANQTAYISRTWTGDNGIEWSATESRNDQTLNGKAITLRSQGKLTNTAAVAGGIGTLNFNYKRVFTGNSTLRVFVNGVQKDSIVVSSETTASRSILINVEGNVNLEFRNSGNRVVIDDVSWDCYGTAVTAPQLQLVDADNKNVDCGTFAVDFGAYPVGTQKDSVFSIRNTGTANLAINSLALGGANAGDFTIVSPLPGAFTIVPQDSTAVTVRFLNASAGTKNAVLTINSGASEECTVALSGTGLLECVAPVGTASVVISEVNPLFANVAVSNVLAGGYLAVLSELSTLGEIPNNTTSYENGDDFGSGMVVYSGADANFAISVLDFGTSPYLHIFPYNVGDCFGGPIYAGITSQSLTIPCAAGYETFGNIETTTSNSYLTRNWDGDSASWQATDARTDQTQTGKAIALRSGSLKNTTPITGGIGTISFNYKRVFTGNSTLKLLVNGDQYGNNITVSSETAEVFSQEVQISGDAVIELVNSENRVVIDNLSWTCYEAPATPKIQLADVNGAQRACGNFTLDFGNIAEGASRTRTFFITNVGGQNLTISSILPDNAAFTVTSVIPSVIAPNGIAEVTVLLNSTGLATGTIDANINISSNDVACSLNLNANVALPCETPATGTVATSNTTYFSTDVAMTGTADGYVAVVTPTPFTGTLSQDFSYSTGGFIADGFIGYVGTDSEFVISSLLNPNAMYYLSVFAYNSNENCAGPAYAEAVTTTFTTLSVFCGGEETFTNTGAPQSNYTTRTWTGDNQVTWTATDARNDQTLNGKAIALRAGTLTNTNFPSSQGMTSLSFNYKRVFTGDSTLKVFVNDQQIGSDVPVTSETPAAFNATMSISGNVTIRIENSGNRVVIDDLVWECNTSVAKPALQGKMVTNSEVVDEIKVYPNPNNGQFQIQLSNSEITADVVVYDLTGKKVFGKNVADNENIDLGNVQKGMYLVSITSEGTVSTKKIVVK